MCENQERTDQATAQAVDLNTRVSQPSIFIDGNFKTGMGDCKYHCCPTCHPGQIGPELHYGCNHKAWPSNRGGDFCPFVDCNGVKSKCELKGMKFIGRYKGALKRRLNCALSKAKKYEDMLSEIKELAG